MERKKLVPHITNTEWYVMQKIWDKSPSTAKELSASMTAKFGWAGNTTYTLIYRLMEKGAVREEGKGHGKLYYACIDEKDAQLEAAMNLIERVYRYDSNQLAEDVKHIIDYDLVKPLKKTVKMAYGA